MLLRFSWPAARPPPQKGKCNCAAFKTFSWPDKKEKNAFFFRSNKKNDKETVLVTLKNTIVRGQGSRDRSNRHLIVHSEKEPTWLYIQRKNRIVCPFGETVKLPVNSKMQLIF